MRARFFTAAFCLALTAGANAKPLPTALVWIPPEDFGQWGWVESLLHARPELRLTVALTPEMATPRAKASLRRWVATGRLEIAARIAGDPILPLVASHPAAPRPNDALERGADARLNVEQAMAVGPAGLVPGGGALDASLVPPLAASGAPWVLAGPYAGADAFWAIEGRATLIPSRALAAAGFSAPGAIVADESAVSESRFLSTLSARLGNARPPSGWATVGELVKAKGDTRLAASEIAAWPTWSGAPATAPDDHAARAAWDAYGEAAKALSLYQNSGAADMRILESATSLLRKAQDARFLRAPKPGAASTAAELRARLLAVYKRIKSAAPDSLDKAAPAAPAERPTDVRAASGANWISFDAPFGALARAPAGASNPDPWRLRGLRVEWDERSLLFRLFLSRLDAAGSPPRPIYDVYIDLNHVADAGSTRLLEGRGATMQARDAWEYALTVADDRARLWRATAGGEPRSDDVPLKIASDPARGELRISVPRDKLRGNPARWGYLVLALADRSPILGLLAPLETQKAVLEKPGSAPPRLPAVRLER